MPSVGWRLSRPLALFLRQSRPSTSTSAAIQSAAIPPQRPWRAYSSPATANRKLNVPIDFNSSSLLAHSPSTALANPELSGDLRKHATTKKMNYFQAVNDALATILEEDEKACIFGEDVAFGGLDLYTPHPTSPVSRVLLFACNL